jgi:nucleoside-diphosphate-sugar epimerase
MKRIIVLGGSGALGKSIVSTFNKGFGSAWETINLDITPNPAAFLNIPLKANAQTIEEDI